MLYRLLALALVLFGIYLFVPTPSFFDAPPSSPSPLSQGQLTSLAVSFELQEPVIEPSQRKLAALGKAFFFDQRFSGDGNISCASCHQPELDFTDSLKTAIGVATTDRNTPTIINSFAYQWFFWDGRSHSLEHQALGPIENSKEHNFHRLGVGQVISRFYREPYEALFGYLDTESILTHKTPILPKVQSLEMPLELAAYGIGTMNHADLQVAIINEASRKNKSPQETFGQMALQSTPSQLSAKARERTGQERAIEDVFKNFGRAIAAYEKTVIANESPFDKFIARLNAGASVDQALDSQFAEKEWQGFGVFAGSGCTNCHHSPIFSDQQFHNIGLSMKTLAVGRTKGAIEVSATEFSCESFGIDTEACREIPFLRLDAPETMGAFKTPTLRNIANTAPYMHDGRFDTLEEVLDHYELIADKEPGIGHISESLRNIEWNQKEREQLIAFLQSLTSPIRELH